MGVRRYQDLVCWRLANELKRQVYERSDAGAVKRDFKFCAQLRDAAASAPANIAEGFACYGHREAARYARIAKASLTETQNHLEDGIDRRYWTKESIAPLLELVDRAIGATTKWLAYLSSTDTPPPYWDR